MKLVIGLLTIVMFGLSVSAQVTPTVPAAPPTAPVAPAAMEAKVIAELAASAERVVKNAPFSADAVSESIQTLADGNRIVHTTTSKLYRNTEGRFRREMKSGSGSTMGSFFSYGPGVTIMDPVVGFRYNLDPSDKTAVQTVLRTAPEVKTIGELTDAQRAAVEKLRAAATTISEGVTAERVQALTGALSTSGLGQIAYAPAARARYETRKEDLGMQNIEGVDAEGTRTITTIPANAIGNERPIEIVYERWYSKELQLVVMSKTNDPRTGEQTYRLINIVRAEPDPSLFAMPTGYKVVGEGAKSTYRVAAAKAETEKAATVRAAQSGTKP